MLNLKLAVKDRIHHAIGILPYGRDFYLKLAGNRLGICYRGKFESMSQARAAISANQNGQYDVVNIKKSNNVETEKKALDSWFHDQDYPLLFWLSQIISKEKTVLELGGSVGHFFYTIQNYTDLPEELSWTIAELPAAVALGQDLASERQEKRLSFIDSETISSAPPADIFVTAGTLQYMESELPQILRDLPSLPSHVLSHNLPMHRNLSYVTLQNLGICEVPYRIYSRPKLERDMQELGYSLKASWTKNREVQIPFHRDLQVEGYCGHYFVLNDG